MFGHETIKFHFNGIGRLIYSVASKYLWFSKRSDFHFVLLLFSSEVPQSIRT